MEPSGREHLLLGSVDTRQAPGTTFCLNDMVEGERVKATRTSKSPKELLINVPEAYLSI